MIPVASLYAPFTTLSTHRVSYPVTERDTISVPVTLSPVGRSTHRLLQRNVAAQDTVAQQAEAAQVGKARSLGEPGDHRQVQRRAQASDRQVEVDPAFELVPRQRAGELATRLP